MFYLFSCVTDSFCRSILHCGINQRHTVTTKDKVWLSLAFVSCFVLWNGFCHLNLKGGCRVTGCCHIATVWVGWSLAHKKTVVSFLNAHRVRGYFPEPFIHKETMVWMAVRADNFHRFTMIHWWKMCTSQLNTMYEEYFHNFDRYFCCPHSLTSLVLTCCSVWLCL